MHGDIMLIHMLLVFPRVVKRMVHLALLPPLQLLLLGVITPHPKDEPRESTVMTPEKRPAPARNQLIDHAVKIRVNALQLLLEIMEKYQVVVVRQRLKPRLPLVIRRHEHRRPIRYLVPTVLVNLIGLEPGVLVLKVTASNVEGVEFARGGVAARARAASHRGDDAGRGALDLVAVAEVITDEALGPEVVLPVLEKQKRVKMRQQPHPHLVITHEMHHVRRLHLLVVNAEILHPPRHRLLQPLQRLGIHVRGPVLVLPIPREVLLDLLEHVRQFPRVLRSVVRGEGRDARVRLPREGSQRDVPQVLLQRLGIHSVPIGPVIGRKDHLARRLVPQTSRHRLRLEEFLRADDVETGVFVGYLFHVIEVVLEGEVDALFVAVLAEEVDSLGGWHDEGAAHGVGHYHYGFEGHAGVVESSSIRFERQIPLFTIVLLDWTHELRIARDVPPVHHLPRLQHVQRSTVILTIQPRQILPHPLLFFQQPFLRDRRPIGTTTPRRLFRLHLLQCRDQLLLELRLLPLLLVVSLLVRQSQMTLFERHHGVFVNVVRIGDAMMEDVARHADEDAGREEEEVGFGGGVGGRRRSAATTGGTVGASGGIVVANGG
mmetsp:Transcript_29593/g.61743  ORF Transcript_29593/g.61743 Transcript_29593/m.61743 type:complete len:602 (+) Transcript_29593:213-2018(+)